MTTQTEALKLALEASKDLCTEFALAKVQEILTEALAQPEQEPVAWEAPKGHGIKRFISQSLYEKFSPEIRKWYKPYKCPSCEAALTQRTWIGLTDKEIFNALGISGSADADYNAVRTLNDARKLEAKLKEKNT